MPTKVNFEKVNSGNRREVWHIFFEQVVWTDGELKFETTAKNRNLGYFFVTSDKIFWIKKLPKNESESLIQDFLKIGEQPKDSLIICQEDEIMDADQEKSGTHTTISCLGELKDIRQFDTWYVKPDFSDVREIYSYSLKKDVGLISYHGRETQAGLNELQLWNDKYVRSSDLEEEFEYL